jgi:hypothetical protein
MTGHASRANVSTADARIGALTDALPCSLHGETLVSNKVKIIAVAAFVVILGGAGLGLTLFGGNPIGGACYTDSECNGFDGVCWTGGGSYCSKNCATTADCPAQWTCNDVAVTNMNGSGHTVSTGSTRMCARPAAATQ